MSPFTSRDLVGELRHAGVDVVRERDGLLRLTREGAVVVLRAWPGAEGTQVRLRARRRRSTMFGWRSVASEGGEELMALVRVLVEGEGRGSPFR